MGLTYTDFPHLTTPPYSSCFVFMLNILEPTFYLIQKSCTVDTAHWKAKHISYYASSYLSDIEN